MNGAAALCSRGFSIKSGIDGSRVLMTIAGEVVVAGRIINGFIEREHDEGQ